MAADPGSHEVYKGPAYALIIGNSQHQYHGTPNEKLADHEFPNLRCAAQDATDVAEFLKNNGFIEYNVKLLYGFMTDSAALIAGLQG